MNEQEAIETLERLFSDSTNEDYPFTECFAEALTIAIQALEEVQQYRAIGTPEELQDIYNKAVDDTVEAVKEAYEFVIIEEEIDEIGKKLKVGDNP